MVSHFWNFTDDEKRIITSIVNKGLNLQAINDKFAIMSMESFYKLFNSAEKSIIKKYLSIDPKSIGYKLPFLGHTHLIKDVVPIKNQTYYQDGKPQVIACQYLPKEAYEAYVKMNRAIQNEIGKSLLVEYGYRSTARQIFIFFDILVNIYDFDFDKTIKRVCFHDYSEHVYSKRQALDFITSDGIDDNFENTEEYKWLEQNAAKFGFYKSYPKQNNVGMMYEPWHWHYEPPLKLNFYVMPSHRMALQNT